MILSLNFFVMQHYYTSFTNVCSINICNNWITICQSEWTKQFFCLSTGNIYWWICMNITWILHDKVYVLHNMVNTNGCGMQLKPNYRLKPFSNQTAHSIQMHPMWHSFDTKCHNHIELIDLKWYFQIIIIIIIMIYNHDY